MIRIDYFASVRERLDQSEEQLKLPEGVSSIEDLIRHLKIINPSFKSVMDSSKKIMVAVNQTVIVDLNYKLSEDDEVAFFPPMTGG